jgi:putative peptidoglycan lipid II flippase
MKIDRLQKIPKLWKNIGSGSVNSRIFSAAIIVGLGTILVKFLAIAKELVVAYQFGTANEIDAFLIALTIPSFLLVIIAGSFNSALIPTYIKVREQEGMKSAQQLFAGATTWSIGLLLIATVLMLGSIPLYLPMLTKGFSPEKLALTYHLLWAIAPMLLLTGIGTIWGAVLNAGEKFAIVALAPMITPAITVILLFGVADWGVFNLVAGMVFGQLLEMAIIGIVLQRKGFSLRPKWYGFNTHLREVANQYAPAIVGSFLMCSTGLVDKSMAAMLPAGSVAALNYGNRIVTLPIIIASTALSTAVMPYFSKMVASEDWHNIRKLLKRYLILIFAASVPLTGFIILFSEQIVQALLQRGSFTENDTQIVAQIQSCFAIQIPFYIGCILLVRLISAMRKNQILVSGSAWNLAVNIGLNYLFMRWLGVAGLALSTSFVYIFSFLFLLFFVIKNLESIDNIEISTEQKSKIDQLYQSKFDRINTVLTSQQRQVFQQIEMQRPSRHQRRNGIDLSADQKNELSAIRQEYMERFRLVLNPSQEIQLLAINGWNQGISLERMKELNLTTLQQEKIAKLWIDEHQQMEAVLTSEQREKIQARQSYRKSIELGWKKLDLTLEQKAQMRVIRQEHKQQLNSILTPKQQANVKSGNAKISSSPK